MKKLSRALWLSIGALALFASACSTDSAVITAEAPDDTTDSGQAAQQDEPTAEPVEQNDADPQVDEAPTAVPAAATPEPEPTDAPTPEPAPVEETDAETTDAGARVFDSATFGSDLTPEQLSCAIGELAGNIDLFGRANDAADVQDLSLDDQADLAIIAFDCAPEALANEFSQALSQGAGDDITFPPEVGECFAARMASGSPERRQVILGFSALGSEVPVPVEAQGPVVDTMVQCIPGNVFADAVSASALEDPALADALDVDCLAVGLDGDALRPMWQAMVENPAADFDSLDGAEVAPLLDAVFGCISFGQIMAAEAGIDLAPDTIACIDDSLIELNLASMIETGEGAEEVGLAMLACLSPEELEALGG